MSERPLIDFWPPVSNSQGTPGTGTKVTKELLDSIRDTIGVAIYDEDLPEGPPEIANEVVDARGGYASLDARLSALEVAAAGGASAVGQGSAQNLVPNDTFLIWPAGDSTAPSYWTADSGLTMLRITAQAYAQAHKIPGRNIVRLTNGDATPRNFYVDVIPAADLTTYGSAPLSAMKVAAGVFIKCSTPGLVTVYVNDGVSDYLVGGNGSQADWVWSPTEDADIGLATLTATPTRLRLIVKMTGAGSADIAGAYLSFAEAAPRYQPSPTVEKELIVGLPSNATPASGATFLTFTFGVPTFIYSAEIRCTTSGAGNSDFKLGKDGTEVMGTVLRLATGETLGTVRNASTVALGSFSTAHVLTVVNTALAAAMRGPTIRVKLLQYVDAALALAGGRVVA